MQARRQQQLLRRPSQPHPAALSRQHSPLEGPGAPTLLLGRHSQVVLVPHFLVHQAAGVEMVLGADLEDVVAMARADQAASAQPGHLAEVLSMAGVVHGRVGPGLGARARSGLGFGQPAGQCYLSPPLAEQKLTFSSSTTASPAPATVTTTINGQVVTGTTFGVQAVSATATGTTGNAAPAVTHMAAGGAMMAALVGVVAAL